MLFRSDLLVTGNVSGSTFYGDGSKLTNISTTDYYVTGGTFNSSTNTLYLYRQNGQVVITGFTSTGGGGGSLTITDDTSTNLTRYPLFVDVTTGTPTSNYVSSSKLNFNPSTGTLSATVFTSLSDKTQKTDIKPIVNAIETVKKLNGVKYKWIDNHNQPSIGLIAQDTEKVLPEVVMNNPNGLKSVSYGNIVGLLIEAIKEQQKSIEDLERKLNA